LELLLGHKRTYKKKTAKNNYFNHMTVSLTSVPGKIVERIVLETISKHVKNKKVIGTGETHLECWVQVWAP